MGDNGQVTTRRGRLSLRNRRTAASIAPLAALSVAWTATLVTANPAAPTAVTAEPDTGLPDGAIVPAAPLEVPASVSSPEGLGLGVDGDGSAVVAAADSSEIPAAALAAYQRAETVINRADEVCNLSWQLIAAIGRVESNHGRFGGNVLSDTGLAQPGIYGIPLNGSNNTKRISDTDGGELDNDTTFDRAVGPMQFIPSTWATVGVDADGDGQRNPQDIDDAALAAAVYLCSGGTDLSKSLGQRSAVYRYNNSESYVDLVLRIAEAYKQGDYMSIPNQTLAAGVFQPAPPPIIERENEATDESGGKAVLAIGSPAIEEPAEEPADEPKDEPLTPGNDPTPDEGDSNPVVPPLPQLPELPKAPKTNTPVDDVVDPVLTLAQALVRCTNEGKIDNPLRTDDDFDQCLAEYTAS